MRPPYPNCARTIAQHYLRNIWCGHARLPTAPREPRLHHPLDRRDRQRARQRRCRMFVFPLIGYALTGSTLAAALVEAACLARHVRDAAAGRRARRPRRPPARSCSSPAPTGARALRHLARGRGRARHPHRPPPRGGRAARPASRSRRLPARADLGDPVGRHRPTTCRPPSARTRPASTSPRCSAGRSAALLYAVTRVGAVRRRRDLLRRLVRDAEPHPDRPPRRSRARVRRRRPLQQVKEGYRFIWRQPFFRTLMVWAAMNNLVINALFFVVIMRLVREGVPGRADRPGLDRRRHRRHPRRAGRAVRDRPDADRRPDRRSSAGCACCPSCRWSVVDAVWRPARQCSSCCCSTRPATPASAPTARP